MKYILTVLFIFFASIAQATTRYVDAIGIDSGFSNEALNCSTPSDTDYNPATRQCGSGSDVVYNTIQGAVTALSVGDTIYLRNGTHTECQIILPESKNGTAWTEGNYNTISSYPDEWAIVDGENDCSNSSYRPDVFTADNGPSSSCKFGCDTTKYWKFERFEVTGGGYNNAGNYVAGLHFINGPVWVRYMYIHDTTASDGDLYLPVGLRINNAHDCIIEYNWIKDNGATSNQDNGLNLEFNTDYHYDNSRAYIEAYATTGNEVRYNVIEYTPSGSVDGGSGFRVKADYEFWDIVTPYPTTQSDRFNTSSTWFTTHKDDGDKIHHNLFKNAPVMGHSEFAQLYNNIVIDSTPSLVAVYEEEWGGAHDPETFWNLIYNNTVIEGTSQAVFGSGDGASSHPYGYIYNNIMDGADVKAVQIAQDLSSAQPTMTDMFIKNNLIHAPDDTSYTFRIGNLSGDADQYTTAEAEAAFGTIDNNVQDNTDSSDLFIGGGGYNDYKTDFTYSNMALGDGGIGGSHPYLAGVTIPSYIGAVNPSDDDWVENIETDITSVEWLASTSTDRDSNDDPVWIEGEAAQSPSSITGISLTGVSIN